MYRENYKVEFEPKFDVSCKECGNKQLEIVQENCAEPWDRSIGIFLRCPNCGKEIELCAVYY